MWEAQSSTQAIYVIQNLSDIGLHVWFSPHPLHIQRSLAMHLKHLTANLEDELEGFRPWCAIHLRCNSVCGSGKKRAIELKSLHAIALVCPF